MVFWGILMIVIGLFLMINAIRKSEFVFYNLLVARSKILWGKYVHHFLMISGVNIVVLGILMATGVIWT